MVHRFPSQFGRRRSLIFVSLILGLLLVPLPAVAQVSAEQAGQTVAETFDVEVLKTRAGEVDGVAVWFVTVMNPSGDFNEAFQVTTLAVEQATGDLVPAFRHRASGYDVPGGRRDDKVGLRPNTAQSTPWR